MPNTATLTPVVIGPNGTGKLTDLAAATTQAALVGGDAYKVQGVEWLVIVNGSGSSVTVTIAAVADNFGLVSSSNNITLAVPAGKTGIIGPLAATKYADSNGLAQITYSAVTTVTVGLYTDARTA